MNETIATMTIFSPTDNDKKVLQEQIAKQMSSDIFSYEIPAYPGIAIQLDRTILLNVKFITSIDYQDQDVDSVIQSVTIKYVKYQ